VKNRSWSALDVLQTKTQLALLVAQIADAEINCKPRRPRSRILLATTRRGRFGFAIVSKRPSSVSLIHEVDLKNFHLPELEKKYRSHGPN